MSLVYLLHSIKDQTVIPNEIVIIDSSDVAVKHNQNFVKVFNNIYLTQSKLVYEYTKPGLTYQRNIGIRKASGDIIYFLDDDTTLAPDYFEQMNNIFIKYPQYAGGMGTIANIEPKREGKHRLFRALFLLQRDYSSGKFTASGMPTHPYGLTTFKQVEVLNGCAAYRKKVFKKNIFDEQLRGYAYMEDCDISRRISYEVPLFFNPAAKLYHYNSPENRDHIVENRAMYIHNYSYLFFKNFYPRNKLKLFVYCWSILGLCIEAIVLRKREWLKGYIYGLREFYKK